MADRERWGWEHIIAAVIVGVLGIAGGFVARGGGGSKSTPATSGSAPPVAEGSGTAGSGLSPGAEPVSTPAHVVVKKNESVRLEPASAWVCSGDLEAPTGRALYDRDPRTGLVFTVPAGATYSVGGPNGGDCVASATGTAAEQLIAQKTADLRRDGCENNQGCASVTVTRL